MPSSSISATAASNSLGLKNTPSNLDNVSNSWGVKYSFLPPSFASNNSCTESNRFLLVFAFLEIFPANNLYGFLDSNASICVSYNSTSSSSPHHAKYSSTSICPLPSSSISSIIPSNSDCINLKPNDSDNL